MDIHIQLAHINRHTDKLANTNSLKDIQIGQHILIDIQICQPMNIGQISSCHQTMDIQMGQLKLSIEKKLCQVILTYIQLSQLMSLDNGHTNWLSHTNGHRYGLAHTNSLCNNVWTGLKMILNTKSFDHNFTFQDVTLFLMTLYCTVST